MDPRTLLVALLVASAAGRATAHGTSGESAAQLEARVRFYAESVQKYPRHYPGYCELGRAYFDLARQTGDPTWLNRARVALATSVNYQPTFEAYRALMILSNHAHRFTEAVGWGHLAAAASNEGIDPEILSGLVEAHMGLGDDAAARRLLGDVGRPATAYHEAAARGRYWAAQGQVDRAVAELRVASQLARDQRFPEHAGWAEGAAARVLLDAGRVHDARPYVERASALAPHAAQSAVLRGRVLLADGQAAAAVAVYRDALVGGPDPELYRRLFEAARRTGDDATARAAFADGEAWAKRALDGGEIYSVGALVQLYLDEGGHASEARRLAELNWRYKRDREARAQRAATRRAPAATRAVRS